MQPESNVDRGETEKFSAFAAAWWDPGGPMHSLHAVNPLRLAFIAAAVKVEGRAVVDVGCGGGLLSEALARQGARVTGLDLSADLLEMARQHAAEQALQIEYRLQSAEQLAVEAPAAFEVVTCMEVLEHIPAPAETVAACARLLKSGGHAFFSTIDRTLRSLLFVIFGGEYVLRLLPVGSHHYRALIRPNELRTWAETCGLRLDGSARVIYNPFSRKFRLGPGHDLNYMMHFIKE